MGAKIYLLLVGLCGGEQLGESAGQSSRGVQQPVAVAVVVERRQQARVLRELRQVSRAATQSAHMSYRSSSSAASKRASFENSGRLAELQHKAPT